MMHSLRLRRLSSVHTDAFADQKPSYRLSFCQELGTAAMTENMPIAGQLSGRGADGDEHSGKPLITRFIVLTLLEGRISGQHSL